MEELMDQCLNKYLQEQTTQDKTSLKDLTNMASQVRDPHIIPMLMRYGEN